MGKLGPRTKAVPSPEGQALWRRAFGAVSKEGGASAAPAAAAAVGGSWGKTSVGTKAAVHRLITALRSRAPGGWSDDRWEETKHWEGIQYAAGHRAAEILSEAEFQVYERDDNAPDGKRPVRQREPGYDLVKLLEKPNPEDSFGDLMYRWYQQMSLTGTGLTYMVESMLGRPMELYSLPTAICTPQPVVNPEFPEGFWRVQPLYPYGPYASVPTPYTSVGAPVDARWMLKYQYPHPLLRYEGFSPYTALRLHIDEVTGIDRSRFYKMLRTFNPNAVLSTTDAEGVEALPEPEIERLRAEIENGFQGPENAGNLFVCPPGWEMGEYGHSPNEMDYMESWDQLSSFICAALGVTKPVMGMTEESSYANLFAALKQFHLLSLNPICNRFSQRITRRLAPFFGEHLIVTIRCKRIDDHEVNFEKIDKGIQGKFITKNEARKLCDMHPVTEPWGNDIAGDPSPMETQQQAEQAEAQKQEAGQQQPGGKGPGGMIGGGQPPQQDKAAQKTQPTPGKLGEGGLGPRKSLDYADTLGHYNEAVYGTYGTHPLFDEVRKAIGNGNGRH